MQGTSMDARMKESEYNQDLQPSEYDPYITFFTIEPSFMATRGYFANQRIISFRNYALSYIEQLSKSPRFDAFVPYVAMTYFDRFMSRHDVPVVLPDATQNLNLFVLCCLTIAWKMRIKAFSVDKFVRTRELNFELEMIQRMELLILSKLEWRMRSLTPMNFVNYFTHLFQTPMVIGFFRRRVHKIITKSQADIQFTRFRPSSIAAAAVIVVSLKLYGYSIHDSKDALSVSPYVNVVEVGACMDVIEPMFTYDLAEIALGQGAETVLNSEEETIGEIQPEPIGEDLEEIKPVDDAMDFELEWTDPEAPIVEISSVISSLLRGGPQLIHDHHKSGGLNSKVSISISSSLSPHKRERVGQQDNNNKGDENDKSNEDRKGKKKMKPNDDDDDNDVTMIDLYDEDEGSDTEDECFDNNNPFNDEIGLAMHLKLLDLETDYMPSISYSETNCFRRQEINNLMSRMMDKSELESDPFLLDLAMNYFDRYVSRQEEYEGGPRRRSIAVGCLIIAQKMCISNFSLLQFLSKCMVGVDITTIVETEFMILDALQWRTRSIMSRCFLRCFTPYFGLLTWEQSTRFRDRTLDVIDILTKRVKFSKYQPSLIAASALLEGYRPLILDEDIIWIRERLETSPFANKDKLIECHRCVRSEITASLSKTKQPSLLEQLPPTYKNALKHFTPSQVSPDVSRAVKKILFPQLSEHRDERVKEEEQDQQQQHMEIDKKRKNKGLMLPPPPISKNPILPSIASTLLALGVNKLNVGGGKEGGGASSSNVVSLNGTREVQGGDDDIKNTNLEKKRIVNLKTEFDWLNPLSEPHGLRAYLRLLENQHEYMPKEGYSYTSFNSREQVFEFICEFSDIFTPAIACLALNYYDRYISKYPGPYERTKCNLIAITCLVIAYKMIVPKFNVSSYLCEYKLPIDVTKVWEWEWIILEALDWKMCSIMAFPFLRLFTPYFGLMPKAKANHLTAGAVRNIIISHRKIEVAECKPSVVAASSLLEAYKSLFPDENINEIRERLGASAFVTDLNELIECQEDVALELERTRR